MKQEFDSIKNFPNSPYYSKKIIKSLNNKKISKLKRNISNPNSKQLYYKLKNISSEHTITSQNNQLSKTNYSNISSNYNSIIHNQLQINFSECEKTQSTQSYYNKEKENFLTDFQKKQFSNISNNPNQQLNFLNLNLVNFDEQYKPIIKNGKNINFNQFYINYDRKKIMEVRNKIHNYLSEKFHRKINSINSNFNSNNNFNNSNIFESQNNFFNVYNDKMKIIEYDKEEQFEKKIMTSTIPSSERLDDFNSLNKKKNNLNVNYYNSNKTTINNDNDIKMNVIKRNSDLQKFISFTDNISNHHSLNKNPIRKNFYKNNLKEKMLNLKINNSKISNYHKYKFNHNRIKSNINYKNININKNKKSVKIENNFINSENIIYSNDKNINLKDNIINGNDKNIDIKNLNKDIILLGYNNMINKEKEMLYLLDKIDNNDFSYYKGSFKSNFDESDLQLKTNNQELIEEKLKMLKVKIDHIN